MEGCSFYKPFQESINLKPRNSLRSIWIKIFKNFQDSHHGHLLIFVHNGKATLAQVNLSQKVFNKSFPMMNQFVTRGSMHKKREEKCGPFRHSIL